METKNVMKIFCDNYSKILHQIEHTFSAQQKFSLSFFAGYFVLISLVTLFVPTTAGVSTDSFANIDHNQTINNSSLKLVQILFRHGHREAETGNFGSGQLTNLGKKQLYELGLFLRHRYGYVHPNFSIDESFNFNQVSIQSSSISRAVQSAQCLAYGLYKNFNFKANWSQETEEGGVKNAHVPDEKIPYEPITLTTTPQEADNIFNPPLSCPRLGRLFLERVDEFASQLFSQNLATSGHQTMIDPNQPGIETFMSIETQRPEIIASLTSQGLRFIFRDLLTRRLYSGPLIKLFLQSMDNRLKNEKDEMRMRLFSGHDNNIQNLLIALNVDERFPTGPDFGACFILELHQSGNNTEPFVEIWYRIDAKGEASLLEIEGCGKPCYLKNFKKITSHLIPTDYEEECLLTEGPETPVITGMAPHLQMFFVGLSTSICFFSLGFLFGRKPFFKRRGYTNLN